MVDKLVEEEKTEKTFDFKMFVERKNKQYAALAVGADFDKQLVAKIEEIVTKLHSNLIIVRLKDKEDFKKLYKRRAMLLILSDDFLGVSENIELVKNLKQKHHELPIPTLFITQNENQLINQYNKKLSLYQEADTYMQLDKTNEKTLKEVLQKHFSNQSFRRSKRHNADIPVEIFDLQNKVLKGRIKQISLHGCVLELEDRSLSMKEQVVIRISLNKYLPIKYGEFMRLSSRVRRVFLGQKSVALSWEFMTEKNITNLSAFMLRYLQVVNKT